MAEVIIYTDGSVLGGNPGTGGWAAVLTYRDREREVTGGDYNTTKVSLSFL